jgi:hypothetical protein
VNDRDRTSLSRSVEPKTVTKDSLLASGAIVGTVEEAMDRTRGLYLD